MSDAECAHNERWQDCAGRCVEALARENYLHSTRRAMLGREWDQLTADERAGWLARATAKLTIRD